MHPLQRIDIGMDVAATDTHMVEVFIQLLGHPFGQRRHQNPLVYTGALIDLLDQIVDLVESRANFDRRIDQTRRAYKLLDHCTPPI